MIIKKTCKTRSEIGARKCRLFWGFCQTRFWCFWFYFLTFSFCACVFYCQNLPSTTLGAHPREALSLSECQLNVFVPRASLHCDRAFLLTWVLSLFSLTLFVLFYQNFFISCGQQPHFCIASTFVGVRLFKRVQVIAKSKNIVWDPDIQTF